MRRLWIALKTPLRWAVAGLILFEQWGWSPLARALGRLVRAAGLARLERRIAALSPHAALAVLFVPAVALLPVKVGALWLVGVGRVALGLLTLVSAKILGTAVVARLFQLTRPQLMRLAWFARLYRRWLGWKVRVVASLLDSPGGLAARALAERARAWWIAR